MSSTTPMHNESAIPQWTVGDRLAKALDHAGIKVQDMADYLEIGRNTVGNYIAGRTAPSRATVLAWALRTGVPAEWIMTGEIDIPTPPTGGLISGELSSACTSLPLAEVVPLRRIAA